LYSQRFCPSGEACLVAGTGATVGKVGFKPAGELYWINQRVFALLARNGVDAGYLFACFLVPIIRLQVIAYASGAAQPNISDSQLKECFLPGLSTDAQGFIGEKVRNAHRLLKIAKNQELLFRHSILDKYPRIEEAVSTGFKHSLAKASELNGSLNPGAFNPDRLYIRSYLKKLRALQIKDVATIEAPVTSDYVASDSYLGLDSIGSLIGTISPTTIEAEGVTGSVRKLSEGPVISKLRPYLNKVAYIPPHLATAFGSTELLCVHAKEPALNWYLCGVLQLPSTVRQLNPVSTGSTHPRVTREDILDCYVPWIDNAESVGLLLANAQNAYFLSDKLLIATRLLVEALMEGAITEDELSNALTGIKQGDQSGDREILGRLCEGGIDATATRPLFPDLDAYYETLRVAEQAQSDGGGE
jgi:type I restriction enzyme S subunit